MPGGPTGIHSNPSPENYSTCRASYGQEEYGRNTSDGAYSATARPVGFSTFCQSVNTPALS